MEQSSKRKGGKMDPDTRDKIEETVLEMLKSADMDKTTEYKIRKSASEKLGMDLYEPTRKKFVKEVVDSHLREQQAKAEEQEDEEEEEDEDNKRKRGRNEYDDEDKRRVTLSEFRGKTLVSIRKYYKRDGKELPSAKGISLTAVQWASLKKNVPAIEKAIRKMESQ